MLARELLNKPDGFIVVTLGEKEGIIEDIRRVAAYSNYDDSSMYWALNIRECEGNLKRLKK